VNLHELPFDGKNGLTAMSNPEPILRDAETPLRDAYARSGVDIDAGNAAVERYRGVTAGWKHPSQLGTLGGFSGLFALPGDDSKALVASADGVGTKVLIAARLQRFDGVGRDLVNHCVNDILVVNAKPLFFLDYYATGKLDPDVAAAVVAGIQGACRAHDAALLGGETAEMPGLYKDGDFDVAGTIVGLVDRADIPDPASVSAGDAIVGLPAIGLHTNGYSLARAVLPEDEWLAPFPAYGEGRTYADALLAEHPSYYDAVRAIQRVARVKVMAHITGGGLIDNVPRTLPADCKAVFEQSRWDVPPLERELVARGALSHEERYRTLNMGVGFTLIVPLGEASKAVAAVPGARVVGWVEARADGEPQVVVHPARTA
jgi:phosphoribosylformylglycinamidine cyclo-ligase